MTEIREVMSYFESSGGGVPINNTDLIVLTKENTPMTFKAGYYRAFDLTTDVSALPKKIRYIHHQCSNSNTGLTFESDSFGTGGATAVTTERTVNGQLVSTKKGGCYQTPYYQYTCSRQVPAAYGTHDFYTTSKDDGGVVDKCRYCGMVIGHGTGSSWGGNTCLRRAAYTETWTGYGTSAGGTVTATYYLKTCGYKNGQTIRGIVTY